MNTFQKIIFLEQMKLMQTDHERSSLERGTLELPEDDPRMAVLEELDRLFVMADDNNQTKAN